MKIDYTKFDFSSDERKHMKDETNILDENKKDHIPVLIQLKSKVLKTEKQKFLVANDINFNDFIQNTLKKRLINLNEDDSLKIQIVQYNSDSEQIILEIEPNSKLLKEIYNEYKDNETNFLIFRISRNTTFKVIKRYARYLTGY